MIWKGDVGDHCNNIGDVGDYCDNIGDVGDYCDNQMHDGDVCIDIARTGAAAKWRTPIVDER